MNLNTLFYSFVYLLITSSIFVVLSNNVVFSLVFLILSFLSASILLILLEVEFLGLLLIVIYVGAIAILFLFAVMLVENKLTVVKKNAGTLSAPISAVFGFLLFLPILGAVNTFNEIKPSSYNTSLICIRELLESNTEISSLGSLLYSYYSVHLLITGMLLLVIILGVFRLTNFLFKKVKHQSAFKQLSRTVKIF
jgi:NADH-quinone oxidoreductase subunit J